MPIHIDEPAPGMAFDPRRFTVKGWLWLDHRHGDLIAVEAWSHDTKLGESTAFTARGDVSAKYALPDETRTAFTFVAAHATVRPRTQFDLQIHARLRDGTRTPPLFVSRVGPLPLDRDPRAKLLAEVPVHALGLEIGAHARPVEGLTPYYTDAVADFAGTAGRVDFLSDAGALPVADQTLDYLCSSHVLEHLPDPIAALHEWHRVLRPGGWLYLVVPDKRFTFDHPRAVTPAEHMLEDFRAARTAASSLEHVDEFIHQTDWSLLHPDTAAAERPARQLAARNRYLHDIRNGRPIDIHFHTFTPESLQSLLEAAGFTGRARPKFEIAAHAERYPPDRTDGIALLLRKTGTPASPGSPANSFTLAVADSRIPPLPLVCPVSLAPLGCETGPAGESALVAEENGHRYSLRGGCPSLLPPSSAVPARAWRPASTNTALTAATQSSPIPEPGRLRGPLKTDGRRPAVARPFAGRHPATPMTHEAKVAQWIGAGQVGVEVGAGGRPVPGLQPPAIQVDCFKAFGADVCEADYYGHACTLPFHDHSLDYVVTSHVLEHVANPIAALAEWYRVVRPGGMIYLVVPNRLATFDHTRELTSVAHLIEDYVAGTTACDPTHIDEFAQGVDWARYIPTTSPDDIPGERARFARGMREAVARGEDINIHFHTFEPSNLRELLETLAAPPDSGVSRPRLLWEIVDFADGFPATSPNGILAVLRVHKGWRARADAEVFRLRTQGDPRAVLRPDARSFAEWSAQTPGLGGAR